MGVGMYWRAGRGAEGGARRGRRVRGGKGVGMVVHMVGGAVGVGGVGEGTEQGSKASMVLII